MAQGNYARDTEVPVARSQDEIERMLQRYGATSFIRGWDAQRAFLAFEIEGRRVHFFVPLPERDDFKLTDTGRSRTVSAIDAAYAQAYRSRWRAMVLVIKAKLEAVAAGITSIEDEFLAHIVLPDGQTAGAWLKPQIAAAYRSGDMPAMLPSGKG